MASYTPSPADWPALEAANWPELLAHLGPSPLAEAQLGPVIAWVVTGIDDNTHNGVAWTQLDAAAAAPVIAAVLKRLRERAVPFLWYVTPTCRPPNLAERLLAAGCRLLGSGVGMAIDLPRMSSPTPPPSGIELRWVDNDAIWQGWTEVHHQAEDLDEDLTARVALYRSLQQGADDTLRHLLALRDGAPVAALSLFFGREAAGLYNVATVPAARRQGIMTHTVVIALAAARQQGYSVAVLGPTPESERMYARIGFVRHDSIETTYTLPFGDPNDS